MQLIIINNPNAKKDIIFFQILSKWFGVNLLFETTDYIQRLRYMLIKPIVLHMFAA